MAAVMPHLAQQALLGPLGTFVTLICLTIGIVALVLLIKELGRRRRERLQRWAIDVGLDYSPGPDPFMRETYHRFKCLELGERERMAFHIASGNRGGFEVTAFEYVATSSTAGSSFREFLTVVIVQPPFPVAPMQLRLRNPLDRLLTFVGLPEVDAGNASLRKVYHVECEDEVWCREALSDEVCNFLLTQPTNAIAMDGRHAIIWQAGRATPERFATLMLTLEGMLDRMAPREA